MSTKIAAHQKKVEFAVQILQTTTGVKVPLRMFLHSYFDVKYLKQYASK